MLLILLVVGYFCRTVNGRLILHLFLFKYEAMRLSQVMVRMPVIPVGTAAVSCSSPTASVYASNAATATCSSGNLTVLLPYRETMRL
jgi:hypothetical protein